MTCAQKIQALLGVARSRAERETLLKVLAIIRSNETESIRLIRA